MRKYFYGAALVAAMMFAFTGCGDNDTNKTNTSSEENITTEDKSDKENNNENQENASSQDGIAEVSVSAVADAIKNGGSFKEDIETVDAEMVLTRMYGLDKAQIAEAAIYMSSGASAEEITVIRVANESDIDAVVAGCEARIDDQKKACEDYLPDEMPKLEDAVVYKNGNYVVMCVSQDSAKAKAIIEEEFAK